MPIRPIRALALMLLAALPSPAAAVPPASGEEMPVRIFAAVAVAPAIREMGAVFTKKSGTRVEVTAGGSLALSQKILDGAEADIFVPEGGGMLTPLLRAGMVTEDASFPFATNSLVVAAPAGKALDLTSPGEMEQERFRRVSIPDPDAVPSGIQAKRSLMSLGLWEKLRGKLVVSPDVASALGAVESGEADLGLLYVTDARRSEKVRVVLALPPSSYAPIRYSVVLVAHPGASPAVRPLLDFLRGDEARRILAASGLTPASP